MEMLPQMDGMTIVAFVAVRSSAAGEFIQVVCFERQIGKTIILQRTQPRM